MAIEWEEVEVKPLRQSQPAKIICDGCGKDAVVGYKGPNKPIATASGLFQVNERNTEENRVSEHGWINDVFVTGYADLCEDCRNKVVVFIGTLSKRGGVRPPDKFGH